MDSFVNDFFLAFIFLLLMYIAAKLSAMEANRKARHAEKMAVLRSIKYEVTPEEYRPKRILAG